MLIDALKRVQADTFAMATKSQYYHWNVEGPDFVQYHEFLGDVYAELFAAVDRLAEHVRQLNAYAPGAHRMIMDLSKINDDDTIPAALEMFNRLRTDNDTVLEGLIICYMAAEAAGELGLSNYLQDRVEAHRKHGWMLRSIVKQ